MISLAIHGGAGTIEPELLTPERKENYEKGLQTALNAGYAVLEKGGIALDAVNASIQSLEDNPLFNAGKGAVFNHIGMNELDASIMCGKTLMAGAVSGLKHIKNPITLAKAVMERSEHVFLYGEGAEEFARAQQFELVDPSYFYDEFRYQQWQHALKEGIITLD
ncbi:MAG: isoaspartyl peptidase/L-asparaginase, partial [Chitinophagales bacterium]|nr:isoaspartyl peptidase/L-asparaginase [Chitinophagales bacterium]